jgi:hypothetical protein
MLGQFNAGVPYHGTRRQTQDYPGCCQNPDNDTLQFHLLVSSIAGSFIVLLVGYRDTIRGRTAFVTKA